MTQSEYILQRERDLVMTLLVKVKKAYPLCFNYYIYLINIFCKILRKIPLECSFDSVCTIVLKIPLLKGIVYILA